MIPSRQNCLSSGQHTHLSPLSTRLHHSSTRSRRTHVTRAAAGGGGGGVHTVTLVLPGGKEAVFRAGTSKPIYDIASYAGVHLPASCRWVRLTQGLQLKITSL